jgi:DNA-binding NtrC family response regulator
VRELQDIVEQVVVRKRSGLIDREDLPEKFSSREREETARSDIDIDKGYDTLVSEFEKTLIMKALNETQGVKSKAARVLNMNRTTLIGKMKRLGLDGPSHS